MLASPIFRDRKMAEETGKVVCDYLSLCQTRDSQLSCI